VKAIKDRGHIWQNNTESLKLLNMLTTIQFVKDWAQNVECSESERKFKRNILTVSCNLKSPLQLRPTIGTAKILKEVKPLYVSERDDDDTISLLSNGEGLILGTDKIEIEIEIEDENSSPSCSFAAPPRTPQQQQQYMGGNYFFGQNTTSMDENDCKNIVSFPLDDQDDSPSFSKETKDRSSSSPSSDRESHTEDISSVDIGTNMNIDIGIDDHRSLVETLQYEKSTLSQRCSDLEGWVSECYKAKMTMTMWCLWNRMEPERDDKAYLLDKCHYLKEGLLALQTDYDSKLDVMYRLCEHRGDCSKCQTRREDGKSEE